MYIYTQDLYKENYKTLMKDIKEELNKGRETPCSWIGRLNTVKSVLPNSIYRFNAITIKIPASYSVDFDKLILKYIRRGKRTRIAKNPKH